MFRVGLQSNHKWVFRQTWSLSSVADGAVKLEMHFDAIQPCIVTVRSGEQSMWGDVVGPDGAEHPSNTDDNNNDSISSTQHWVVVKYVGKKSVSYFLGQVLEVADDGIEVSLSHVSQVVTVYTNFWRRTSMSSHTMILWTRRSTSPTWTVDSNLLSSTRSLLYINCLGAVTHWIVELFHSVFFVFMANTQDRVSVSVSC